MGQNPWKMYDELIEGVPESIAVTDFCLGQHWCYVEAECGCGIGHMVPGGGRRTFRDDPRTLDLRSLAALIKSWSFPEATLGMAALNAWYSQPEKVRALGGEIDTATPTGSKANPFDTPATELAGKNIVVVGHFPNVEAMGADAHLTILERDCKSALDTPDPACEYVVPDADLVLMTGITITNKTAPRLLELARNARTTIAGPSAIPAPCLKGFGADVIAGSVVVDAEQAKLSIRGGSKAQWRAGIKKFTLEL